MFPASLIMLLSIFLLMLPIIQAATISLPSNGTYAVDARIVEVIDPTRTYNGQVRRIMTTVYFPIGLAEHCQPYTVPYWPNLTATVNAAAVAEMYNFTIPNNTFQDLKIQLCDSRLSYNLTNKWETPSWPLTLFSTGLGAVRQIYSALASEVASRGNIVITMDTPGQSYIVEYPDAPPIYANASFFTSSTGTAAVPPRVGDFLAVKKAAFDGRILPHNKHFKPDPERIVVWGHSIGGAAAAEACAVDTALKGGINFDGTIWPPANTTGVHQPFLIWTRDGALTDELESHEQLRDASTGPELGLKLGVVHNDFSDIPLIAEAYNFTDNTVGAAGIGSIGGRRIINILSPYVHAWFRFCFSGITTSLLEGPNAAYPEVGFNVSKLV